MSDFGLISIIMAAYNAEKTIRRAIDSVLTQSYPNWELIIVNDCSRDQTAAIADAYSDSRIHLLNNPKNLGVSLTRQRAVAAAQGTWIAILDSDDAWQPSKLEKQIQKQQETGAKLLFTASSFMKSDGSSLDWILHVPPQISYRKLLKQNLISNSSVLVEKRLYEANQIIRDDIHEDFACWLRILRGGSRAIGIDEPLLIYRLSDTSKTGNKLKAAKMNWRTYLAVGLGGLEAAYYMIFYTINGLLKYAHINKK